MDRLTMDDIGYFLYMQEMERKQKEAQEQAKAQVQAEDAEEDD